MVAVGITLYVADCRILVALNNLPEINDCKLALAPPLITAECDGSSQLYLVLTGTILPTKPTFGDTSNVTPLHTTVLNALNTGVGFTNITRVKEDPVHAPDKGTTV